MKATRQLERGVCIALVLLLVLALLVACNSNASAPPTLMPIAVLFTDTPSPTIAATSTELRPTESPTITSTSTATSTVLPSPTATPPPVATPCMMSGHVISGTYSSTVAQNEQNYRLYLPPCYDDGRRYPALYLMAGNIHDESKWDELGVDEAADAAISAGEIPPFLIVMPDGGWQANSTSGGPNSYESMILDELIPHIERQYCAWSDARGRAIGGLSRGGYWALEIAFRFPERFVAVGGHSAALLDDYAEPDINPEHTALNNALGDLRIYLDIGAEDFVREDVIRLHENMEMAGVPHEWHLNEGQHVDAYWAEHIPDYLSWYGDAWAMSREDYPPCA